MKRNSDYKNQAIQALDGNWGMAAVMTLIFLLIFQAPSVPSYFVAPSGISTSWFSTSSYFDLITILLLPLSYGYNIAYLSVIRGRKIELAFLFDGFKEYGRMLGTLLLITIYEFLWTLLLIVPGIIKSYSYSMTIFVMRDNPSLSFNAAIEKSMDMMSGKKMKLFLLDLSLIGWVILSCLTLGIGFLLLIPYYTSAHAAFYEDLKREKYGTIEIIED